MTRGTSQDIRALEALEDRALVFAQQNAHFAHEAEIERSMRALPKQMNDVFASVNPATGLIEATVGVRARGDDVGRELTPGERARAAVEGTVAAATVAATGSLNGAARDMKVRVGGRRPLATTRPKPNEVFDPTAKAKRPPEGEVVIGKTDMSTIEGTDILPQVGDGNFNVDLRTGVITRPKGAGRISAADQRRLAATLDENPSPGINGSTAVAVPNEGAAASTGLNLNTGTTTIGRPPARTSGPAAAPRTAPRTTSRSTSGGNRVFDPTRGGPRKASSIERRPVREKVIGRANLKRVDEGAEILDAVKGRDNFNVDLKTGRITTQPKGEGRLRAKDRRRVGNTMKEMARRDARVKKAREARRAAADREQQKLSRKAKKTKRDRKRGK